MATKQKKKPSAFDKPVEVSEELAEIVKGRKMKRSEVTKKVWAYIKKHDLQDEEDRRTINPDAKFAKVVGKKPINMFKMTKLINKHLSS